MEGRKKQGKRKEPKNAGIYSRCMLSHPVVLNVKYIGKNLKSILERSVKTSIEGKCIVEGFVKTESAKIISYSCGVVQGENVKFEVALECQVCYPVEGMLINCIARNITKAGIRAESSEESPSPIICFISRDHHINSSQFNSINEGDTFISRVIGQRFEINDDYVSIIGELVVEKR